ncbi:unnamed protein product [Hymenolepis diminuta]|uniref:PID domain-containing protein n=1 Tax=Hymenolepis diminuta TaxID=6216 RepID=A0A0R3SII9_HYMDI|nr:unnamed protein product [Hymenolepis diminuta]
MVSYREEQITTVWRRGYRIMLLWKPEPLQSSTKNPKDYVKNVGIFHHNSPTDATWYTQHRNIYKNVMTDLSHATPITMVLREFNGSNNYLCSAYFQSMDSADLTCEKMISKLGSVDGDNSPLFNLTISEDQNMYYHIDTVLSKKTNSDVSFLFSLPCCDSTQTSVPLGQETRCQEDLEKKDRKDPVPIRQMSEAVTIIETALSEDVTARTPTKMTTETASAENLLRAGQ